MDGLAVRVTCHVDAVPFCAGPTTLSIPTRLYVQMKMKIKLEEQAQETKDNSNRLAEACPRKRKVSGTQASQARQASARMRLPHGVAETAGHVH